MMEVKQNTAVDLNDLLAPVKNSGTDEVDDVVMTDLSDRTHELINCDLIKANEVENENAVMTSLIKEVDVGVDLNTAVDSELDNALLAEDDVLRKIASTKTVEPTPSANDDILAEKAETSNSTTSSNNARDPGDDLDTLLSKINDIVEDCIENESESTTTNTIKSDQAISKINNTVQEKILNEVSLLVNKDTNVIDDSDLIEKEKLEKDVNIIHKDLGHSEQIETLTGKPSLFVSEISQEASKNLGVVTKDKNDILDNDKKIASASQLEISNDKGTNHLNSIDKEEDNISNLQKTVECNEETVKDKILNFNSNEGSEAVETTQSTTTSNGEIIHSPKAVSSDKVNETQNNEEYLETTKKTLTETNKKLLNEGTTTSGNVDNEDSDDEIVFYVDKPPEIEKSKETDTKSLDPQMEITTTENLMSEKEMPPAEKIATQDDDDVVLLLDDDDEEVEKTKKKNINKEVPPKSQIEKKSEEGILLNDVSAVSAEKNIVIDNSDNARDDFGTENLSENEKSVDRTLVTETPEETNSNCSSSSNLLQEAKSVKDNADEHTPEEVENEEEEDDGEVELIESELKDSESLGKIEDPEVTPPAKRLRLSEDDDKLSQKLDSRSVTTDNVESSNIEKKEECQHNSENEKNFVSIPSTLKRSHDVIEVEGDEKSNDSKASNEEMNKKAKTDSLKADIFSEKTYEYKDDKNTQDNKYDKDMKNNLKAVPSFEPIRLYPAPKFGTLKSELPISLDFLKKFRKSFDNMTKQDLEELVLQKVVEAIIHKSEFSEMRELIEKQEKIINAHRTKISELSKQFRDLEMVHNRVVKDIEQRNSQFIMPVKITRAVGLQVYIPNKKSLAETPSSSIGPNVSSSPQRPISSQTSSTSSTSLTPPQRQFMSSQTEAPQQRPTGTASSGSATTGNVRRGCVQKITPIRPVPGTNQPTSVGPTAVAYEAYRNSPNHSSAIQPRILNKNAGTTVNATAIQRSGYLGSNQENQRIPTQQISRTSNMPANSQRVVAAAQSKSTSSVAAMVQRRSELLPSQNTNSSTSSIVDNYINTLTHLTGGNTAVSITPAKPKEKAIIDLTDEDEVPGQSAGGQTVNQMPGTQVPRRILPAQNNSNSQLQYGRAAPSMARVPPANQLANNKNRQISSLQTQKNNSFTAITTPPGTSITRINVAPSATNVQRVKYSHPAPLPATPPQAFNPAWKLPPPRPTIRISNLDNGIVISWTMEESMDRHAECVSYQIYAYQETSGPPMVDSWRHVGDVKAMLLPMAVTLTQFQEGQRYYFAVRAVDCHQRYGPFSLPKTWS